MTDEGPVFTFLAIEDVLSLHEDAINSWGGTHGLRDRGLLESALGAASNLAIYDGDHGRDSEPETSIRRFRR